MAEEKKKGFLSSLFAPKKSNGCCCNVQFEEVPKEDKVETTEANTEEDNEDKSKKDESFGIGDCCR